MTTRGWLGRLLGVLTPAAPSAAAVRSRVEQRSPTDPPILVCVEGNVGIGKSAAISRMVQLLESDGFSVMACPENVSRWLEDNLLQPMYASAAGADVHRSTATVTFETLGPHVDFCAREVEFQKLTYEKCNYVIWERQPRTTRDVFNAAVQDPAYGASHMSGGHVRAMTRLFSAVDQLTSGKFFRQADVLIYLKGSADTCIDRIKRRDRLSESAITEADMNILSDCHDRFVDDYPVPSRRKMVVDCNVEEPDAIARKVVDWTLAIGEF